eukprot:TRINITY_DN27647_c0_g1_i1.p1 TRINITY_DN27647_c0_g1~~TRINITY_DN27647_c0_g1_i1.p1  ORF type:complete len:492 (+),score=175.45 TRINITY_DN27647_c0_g1_i1:45-1520(+)
MDSSWRSADLSYGDTKDRWSDRIAAWDKLISDESKRQTNPAAMASYRSPVTEPSYHATPTHTMPQPPRMAATLPLPEGRPPIGKPVGDELERIIGDKLVALGSQVREMVDKEWQAKVPQIEFGIKEKHAEMKTLFDKNTRMSVTIGDKVLELETAVGLLNSHENEGNLWRREIEARMRGVAEGVDELRGKGSDLRVREADVAREREELKVKLQALDVVKDEQRSSETRMEAYVKEEIRCSERRQEVGQDTLLAKVRNLEKQLQEEADSQRLLGRKLQSSEDSFDNVINELAKTKGKLGKYIDEVNDQGEDLDELRNVVKQMEQSTRPGYCQGCRLVSQDMENKLFSIKQSICYLDQTLKGANSAPAASPQQHAASPAFGKAAQGGVDPAVVAELEAKIEYLHTAVANVKNDLDQMKMEIDDIANPAHVPESFRAYVDNAVAQGVRASEEHVLNQIYHVKDTLDLWAEEKGQMRDQMDEVLRRLSTVEDKLE